MSIDIDSPVIKICAEAMEGHHPERGGPEREQAIFVILQAAIESGFLNEASGKPRDELEEMIQVAEQAERRTFGPLYSNCVILDFSVPLTRAQIEGIEAMVRIAGKNLPPLRERPVCGEREGNSVVPTIAADEC